MAGVWNHDAPPPGGGALWDRSNTCAGSGVVGDVPRVGEKRPQRESECEGDATRRRDGNTASPESDDEPPETDYEELLPLSVAELYHEDEDDVVRALERDDETHENVDVTTCPVCFQPLNDVADTDAARVAHVNACLDGDAHWRDGSPDDDSPIEINSDDDTQIGEWHAVAAWAISVDQLFFAERVVRFRITWNELGRLTDDDLIEMEIGTLGDRKRIAGAITRKAGEAPVVSLGDFAKDTEQTKTVASETPVPPRPRSGAGWHPTRTPHAVAPVFQRGAKAGADSRNSPPPPKPNMRNMRNTNGARPGKSERGTESENRTAHQPRRYTPSSETCPPPPPWIRVPGTKFIVDGFFGYGKTHGGGGSFGSGSSGNQPWCTNWFLTHFHADHYKGLTKSTPGVGCKIWCSRPTAELCIVKLGIQKERLRVVDVGRPFKVEGVSVTFVDANHCPGAVMIIFDDIPNGSGNGSGTSVATSYQNGPVLATGDCRFHSGMLNCPLLQALSAKKPAVMLDTTYCDPKHAFPKQTEMLKNVRDAVLAENHNPKVLFLFGTYTIGKEKVFFTAAEALQKKLYVGKQKKKVLDALGDCLTIEERGLITSDDTATNLHVVPMGSTSFDRMKLIKKYYKNRYDTIVAFKPTGWTFTQTKKNDRGTKRSKRGQLIQYAVPYSEHSSFSELRELVKFLQPRAIMPHVGNDRGEKARRMVRYLTLSDEELAGELEA